MPNVALRSPWLEQLTKKRTLFPFDRDLHADVVIVGAGIAGVMTAYFLLKKTKKSIVLLEGDRIAHGATGHNAGQLVSYFERPFADIVQEFGAVMAAEGQRSIESCWDLLEDIQKDLGLETPLWTFDGYAGCADFHELLSHLYDNEARDKAGLPIEKIFVSRSYAKRKDVPRPLRKYYKLAPHKKILSYLQTSDASYIATIVAKKGCMNSALFCYEVLEKLLARYAQRFTVAEHAFVERVHLFAKGAELKTKKHKVTASRVVLCTNGFEKFHIENHAGARIDAWFHHLVRGSVGYMAAFIEKPQMAPTAISYLPKDVEEMSGAYDADPYYYITRRPHGSDQSLVCIGGPEALMDDTNAYSRAHPYPKESEKMIRQFTRATYAHSGRRLTFTHLWHGLMGYTPNGIRCVGTEPCNPVLLYNLGCNGVGILPSVYGGYRIAQILSGKRLQPSIFDPRDIRDSVDRQAVSATRSDWWMIFVWGMVTAWMITVLFLVALGFVL